MDLRALIDRLSKERSLTEDEWMCLFRESDANDRLYARDLAAAETIKHFGKRIWFRGIVELSNYCTKNCYYCGIRHGNRLVSRYRLTSEQILECCTEGYREGFRTFVLQGGEDPFFTDELLCKIIAEIRCRFPDCAITLSLGERDESSYRALYEAGADRYLLRHETADAAHYAQLHPETQFLENRMDCLWTLKKIGYQTGCGMMVGTPFQTAESLAKDMLFMSEFQPEMVGIGPFLPHSQTPFAHVPAGSTEMTLFVLALCRLMLPRAMIPATTALGTAEADGRQLGVLSGCNVVMPNLSPLSVRENYMLYDNKIGTGLSAAEGIAMLRFQMEEIGYETVIGRGDFGKAGVDD